MSSDDAKASLSSGIASQNTLLCRNCIDAALSETVELGIAREFFRHLCSELESVPVESNNFVISVASDAVERIRSSFRAAYLDVADFSLRNILWSALSGEGEYERAATALSTSRALREEAGGSSVADELRAHAFVCIAQSYLHLGDEVSADSNIRRAGDIIESETTAVSWKVQLMYKTCVARILDSKRRFFEAAVRYAELSRLSEDQIDEMELIAMLEKAVDCILLAPINASRQRVMGSLMRDSRIARIKPQSFSMLQRMSAERLISAAEAKTFAEQLPIHMRATDGEGLSVFDKAIIEHNLIAVSRIYSSITFSSLGELLGVDPRRAEKFAARMVNERQLSATIDQVDDTLDFLQGGKHGTSDKVVAEILSFDASVKDVCLSLNEICDGIGALAKK